jgi:hypothetical protein
MIVVDGRPVVLGGAIQQAFAEHRVPDGLVDHDAVDRSRRVDLVEEPAAVEQSGDMMREERAVSRMGDIREEPRLAAGIVPHHARVIAAGCARRAAAPAGIPAGRHARGVLGMSGHDGSSLPRGHVRVFLVVKVEILAVVAVGARPLHGRFRRGAIEAVEAAHHVFEEAHVRIHRARFVGPEAADEHVIVIRAPRGFIGVERSSQQARRGLNV